MSGGSSAGLGKPGTAGADGADGPTGTTGRQGAFLPSSLAQPHKCSAGHSCDSLPVLFVGLFDDYFHCCHSVLVGHAYTCASKGLECTTAHPRPDEVGRSCAPVSIAWAGPAHLHMLTVPVLSPNASAVRELITAAVSVQVPPVLRAAGGLRRGPLDPRARQGTAYLGHQGPQARQPATGLPDCLAFPRTQPLYSICADPAVKALVSTCVMLRLCLHAWSDEVHLKEKCTSFQDQRNGS